MQSKSYCLIPLYGRAGIVGWTLVDPGDYEFAAQYRWNKWKGYAFRGTTIGGRAVTFHLHRELLGLVPGDGFCGDHINRNRLDNRRSNLRVITRDQNAQNVTAGRGSSPFRGVSHDPAQNRWIASVRANGRLIRRVFKDEIAAARHAEAVRRELLPYAEPDPALAALDS